MLFIVLTLVFGTAFQTANAQQIREIKRQFKQIGSYDNYCRGYVTFDAKFTGFASRMNAYNAQLYILDASDNLRKAIENQGIIYEYHSEIGENAYKIPRFTLYMKGWTVIGNYNYTEKYSEEPFKLQVSETLGDYTTPEFGELE